MLSVYAALACTIPILMMQMFFQYSQPETRHEDELTQ